MGRIKVKDENKGMTNAKQRRNIVEQVGDLELGFAELVKSVNASFKQVAQDNTNVNNHMRDFDLVLQAMMEVLDGSEKTFSIQVAEVVKRLKIAELEAKGEKQLAELKIMETEGKITKAETVISYNDFVVTSTKDENGQQRYPTKSVGIVGMFIPAVKELLINKKVGETLTIPSGGTLEILEVYTLTTPPGPDESSEQASETQQESCDSPPESVN